MKRKTGNGTRFQSVTEEKMWFFLSVDRKANKIQNIYIYQLLIVGCRMNGVIAENNVYAQRNERTF